MFIYHIPSIEDAVHKNKKKNCKKQFKKSHLHIANQNFKLSNQIVYKNTQFTISLVEFNIINHRPR